MFRVTGRASGGWVVTLCFIVGLLTRAVADPTTNDFSGTAGLTPYTTTTWGTYSGALLQSGALRLTYATGQSALVAFNRTAEGPHRLVTADFTMAASQGADGFSFNLLNTTSYGTNGLGPFKGLATAPTPFEEPVLTNAFSVAFDIYDPDDYQGLGPHEVSLHWNGAELAKRPCPVDFRTGAAVKMHVQLEFVPGGAEVTVTVAGTAVYDHEFIAGPVPFEARAMFAARTGGISFTSRLDNVHVDFADPYVVFAPPQTVRLMDHVWINGGNRTPQKTSVLPASTRAWERIVLRVELSRPTNGFDVYDRQMNLSLTSAGQSYEIARFITPFGQGGVWYVDVTDFQPLLRGSVPFTAFIDTYVPAAGGQYGSGWLYTADLMYYVGEPDWTAYKVQNLWNGEPRYGDASAPIATFFKALAPVVEATAAKVKVRLMVTGHGQSPNSENGAEFLVRGRTLKVGTTPFSNVLWRNDCFLNPNRPQPGTWQYSRAGWCPGARVDPWMLDVSALAVPGRTLPLTYTADGYSDTTIDQGNPARQWVASQLVSYHAGPTNAPALQVTTGPTGATLSWPSWAHRHELFYSPQLEADSTRWSRMELTPALINGAFVVILPVAAEAGFYALQTAAGP